MFLLLKSHLKDAIIASVLEAELISNSNLLHVLTSETTPMPNVELVQSVCALFRKPSTKNNQTVNNNNKKKRPSSSASSSTTTTTTTTTKQKTKKQKTKDNNGNQTNVINESELDIEALAELNHNNNNNNKNNKITNKNI